MKDIVEMVDDYIEETGLARIEFRATDGVGVVFLDENEFIPLWDLAYNGKLGFFKVSDFPDQEKEGGYIEPAPTKYYLARIKTFDGEEEYFNYAIVPDDGLRPFVLGEKPSVEALLQTITRFVEAGDVDFDLDEADYDDLQTWLGIEKAGQQFGVGVETLRKAAQRGAEGEKSGVLGAKKDGKKWIVPLAGLKQWMRSRPKRGPAGRKID